MLHHFHKHLYELKGIFFFVLFDLLKLFCISFTVLHHVKSLFLMTLWVFYENAHKICLARHSLNRIMR